MIDSVRRAATEIPLADALLIGEGAGMGVDTILPEFWGNEGFWKAYPPFEKLVLCSPISPRRAGSDRRPRYSLPFSILQRCDKLLPHVSTILTARMPFKAELDTEFEI